MLRQIVSWGLEDLSIENLEDELKEASRPLLVALSDFIQHVYGEEEVLRRFATMLADAQDEPYQLTVVDDVRRFEEVAFFYREAPLYGYGVFHAHLTMTAGEQTERLSSTRSALTAKMIEDLVSSSLETEARDLVYKLPSRVSTIFYPWRSAEQMLEDIVLDLQCIARKAP